MICRLDFLCFVGTDLFAFTTFPGEVSFGQTSGPVKMANGKKQFTLGTVLWGHKFEH